MVVTKSTIGNAIWNLFYDRLDTDISSVPITGGKTIRMKTVTGAYSDEMLDSKANYPILVVDQPEYSEDSYGLTKTVVDGTINVEIYTNQQESAMKFLDAVKESIETYKTTLRDEGIRFVDVQDISSDMVERGRIKIHVRRIVFSFNFVYEKTKAW